MFSIVSLLLCYKNVCSKQAGSCFLDYSACFLRQKICLKSLFKTRGGCFLVYWITFVIRNICVQIKQEAAFLIYLVTFVIRKIHVYSKSVGGCFCNTKNVCSKKREAAFLFIVSETRRSRDIKIPLCLSAPVRKSLI